VLILALQRLQIRRIFDKFIIGGLDLFCNLCLRSHGIVLILIDFPIWGVLKLGMRSLILVHVDVIGSNNLLWISLRVFEINAVELSTANWLSLGWINVPFILLDILTKLIASWNRLLAFWNRLSWVASTLSLNTNIMMSFAPWLPELAIDPDDPFWLSPKLICLLWYMNWIPYLGFRSRFQTGF